MRFIASLFVLTFATGAIAQESGRSGAGTETTRLALKPDKSQEYVFQVDFQGLGADKTGAVPGSTEKTERPGQPSSSGQAATSSEAFRALETGDLEYRINVLKVSPDGDVTLSVMVDAAARGMEKMQPGGSDPGKRENDPGNKDGDLGKKDEQSEINPDEPRRDSDRSLLGSDKEAKKVVTVRVSPEGRIMDVTGLEEWRATGGGASEKGLITADEVRSHLKVIFGSGLHGATLERGKVYTVQGHSMLDAAQKDADRTGKDSKEADRTATDADRTGKDSKNADRTAKESDRTGKDATSKAEDRNRNAEGAVSTTQGVSGVGSQMTLLSKTLETLKFRFEGTTRQGNQEVARFAVLDSGMSMEKSGGTSPSSTSGKPGDHTTGKSANPSTAKPLDEKAAGAGNLAAEGRNIGEAIYRVDDGLLERVNVQINASSAAGVQASMTPRFTIRRVSVAQTEPPRSGG